MNIFIFLLGILSFLTVFTVIVFVHEMGHFLTARFLGFKVDAFSIGFGKPLWQKTDKHGTQWRISALPLGGFVKFAGDSGAASVPDVEELNKIRNERTDEKTDQIATGIFHFMPVWKRALVTLAGPLMNFAFAIVIFSLFLIIFGKSFISPSVGMVVPDSAAEKAGFVVGDLILSANGEKLKTFRRLSTIAIISANDPITFEVMRQDKEVTLQATPRAIIAKDPFGRTAEKGFLGIGPDPNSKIFVERYGPVQALQEGANMTAEIISDQVAFVGRLLRGKGSPEMLGGPLRILYVTGKVGAGNLSATQNEKDTRTFARRLLDLVMLAGMLSVAIGLINLAPVPMLDGGHLVFYAYEAVVGKPMQERLQIIGYKVGLVAVICLMAFATFNDLRYFNVFDFFGQLFS